MRSRIGLGVFVIAALALALYAIAALPHGRTASHGRHRVALEEFGEGVPVTQGFDAANDGLDAVRVQTQAAAPHEVIVECRVLARDGGGFRELARSTSALHVPSGRAWHTLRFPPVVPSAGRSYAVGLRAVSVDGGAPRGGVALVASRDRHLRFSYLIVGGRERWGDLVFEARAIADTWWGRFRLNGLPSLPPRWQMGGLFTAGLAVYVLLMVAWLLGVWSQRTRRARPAPPDGGRARRGWLAASLAATLVLAGLAAVSVVARVEQGRINLIDRLYTADLQTSIPLHEGISLQTVEIGPDARRAIFAHPTSRIAWRVAIPAGGRLRTDLAIHPNGWLGGDGVMFRVQVAPAGGRPAELLARHVNPQMRADRRWIPIDLDLSPYAGQAVDVTFVTEPSRTGVPPDGSYDWALWGEPRIR